MRLDFQECQACAAKSGSPTLCGSCLQNRAVIESLRHYLKDHPAAGRASKVGMCMVGIIAGNLPWIIVLWWVKWVEWLEWVGGKL